MSVLIKGMEMPKSCCDCPLFKSNNTGQLFCRGKRVAFGKEDAEWLPKTTPNWCPLVPVPPHGRLIDGDVAEAITVNFDEAKGDFWDGILYVADWISKQTTIIEAEEGET